MAALDWAVVVIGVVVVVATGVIVVSDNPLRHRERPATPRASSKDRKPIHRVNHRPGVGS